MTGACELSLMWLFGAASFGTIVGFVLGGFLARGRS
jgi:hypothetical protein